MSFIQRFLPHALSVLYVLGKNSTTIGSVAACFVAACFVAACFVAAGSGKPQAQRAAETKK